MPADATDALAGRMVRANTLRKASFAARDSRPKARLGARDAHRGA